MLPWVEKVEQGFPPGEGVEAGKLKARRSLCSILTQPNPALHPVFANSPKDTILHPAAQAQSFHIRYIRKPYCLSLQNISGTHIYLHPHYCTPDPNHYHLSPGYCSSLLTGLPISTQAMSPSHIHAPQGCQNNLSNA